MLSRSMSREGKFASASLALAVIATIFLAAGALAQDTGAGTGTIKGTVTSSTGTPIADARVVITDRVNGKTTAVRTGPAGGFVSGELEASEYNVRVEARSYITITAGVKVKEGETSEANLKLAPEPLPGVVPASSVGDLPLRDLNFLQLLQLEPGVQVQTAGALVPARNALPAVSAFGRTGVTAPLLADGTDLTNRIWGNVVQNVPSGAVQEFQLGGLLAPATRQLFAPGAINFVSRSGGNGLHGDLFGFYTNGGVLSARLPGGQGHDWGRQQYGGRLGGALIKDKLFFFFDAQRNRLDVANPVLLAGPFSALSPAAATIREPFREVEGSGRLDYKLSATTKAFYRFGYDQSSEIAPFSPGANLQPFSSSTHTPSHTLGADFASGSFVHSIRFEYVRFRDVTSDAYSEVGSVANPRPDFAINIGGGSIQDCAAGALLCLGSSPFSNENNYQSNTQFRYDGSRVWGSHLFHFGANFDRVMVGRFAALYSVAPVLSDQGSVMLPAGVGGSSGVAADPLAYPVQWAFLGNGQGFGSEKSGFGLSGGALTDNEFTLYVGDSWKINPNLTVTYGLHWTRDTVPNNSDLPAIAQLNALGPTLGDPVRQPNLNFAPQIGVAWDPSNGGTTLIRGGIGMFYDQSSFLNAYMDRPLRLQQGSYFATPAACVGGAAGRIQWPTALAPNTVVNGAGIVNSDGTVSPYDPTSLDSWCGESMGAAGPLALALQQAYQSASASAASNPVFLGNPGAFAGPYQNGLSLISPHYQMPRTIQMNVGLRHELFPGLIFTADYWREVTTHTLLGVDMNRGGAAATFNLSNAIADRDAAQTANGCLPGAGQVRCMVAALGASGALDAYGAAGVGGPAQVTGGAPCPSCAFPGINPNFGVDVMNIPEGRSVYTSASVALNQQITNFSRGVRHASFQIAYAHSRYMSQGQDSSLAMLATDYANADRFTGPGALDRTHQFTFGTFLDLERSLQISFLGRFASPLPLTLRFQQTSGGAEVLVTDSNGDGSTGDIIPGSNVGSYMRGISASGLKQFISTYNSTYPNSATTPETPAGVALVNAGVFSLQDLQSIGGVFQPLAAPVVDPAGLSWLKTFDIRLGWEHHLGEHVVIAPSISAFNLFNFANFDLPGNTQSGVLNFGAGSSSPWATQLQPQGTAGGTSPDVSSRINRASVQSNSVGAQRTIEWGLKISF
jgi:Carboxypeptidase regulatory-like domain